MSLTWGYKAMIIFVTMFFQETRQINFFRENVKWKILLCSWSYTCVCMENYFIIMNWTHCVALLVDWLNKPTTQFELSRQKEPLITSLSEFLQCLVTPTSVVLTGIDWSSMGCHFTHFADILILLSETFNSWWFSPHLHQHTKIVT